MGIGPEIEAQGPSLPPRYFASTRFRRPATPASRSWCGLLCVWAMGLGVGGAAQTNANLSAPWTPLGPSSVSSLRYGAVTGRVSAIAPDPNDGSGNTVYVGTTGGGIWKSTSAAGTLGNVRFVPLTDTLPVFSANAGTGVVPSLTIGAIAVQPGLDPVVLAGTGDANDALDSYYGEGLLRSTDGGLTWALIQGSKDGANGNHSFTGLVTAGLAFSTATPTLVVAAMSVSPQAAIVNAAGVSSIPGLYYSTDAGVTWQMATIYDGSTVVQEPQPLGTGEAGNPVTSVVWDGLRGQFFAAVRSHGYYASSDGATWTRLTVQPGTGLTTANCPVGSNGLGSANCPLFRGVLAVQPVTGDLYALTVDASDRDQGLWQDLCQASSNVCATVAPTFANRIDNGALEVGGGDTEILQGSYDLALSAAPAAASGTVLFAGTVDLYKCSLAAGATSCTTGWRDTTNALNGCDAPAQVAPAQHALATVAQTSGVPLLYLGNDSGLWRSLDGVAETGSACAAGDASHFDDLNTAVGSGGSGGGLAEVVGFAQDPTANDTLIAGLGANGSAATATADGLTAWPQLSQGEGGFPWIDAVTPTNWYISIGAGVNIEQCNAGSNCLVTNVAPSPTVGEAQVNQDTALLDAPTLLDPALTTNLLAGTCRVWRGPAGSGSGWSDANAISPAFDGTGPPCTTGSALIRSVAAGGPSAMTETSQSSGSTVIYAGMAGLLDGGGSVAGHLFVTASASATTPGWADAALGTVTNDTANGGVFNPGKFDVSAVYVDPHDGTGGTVYAAVLGFGVPHVYRSVDFGAHWLNVSGNLPDAPANAVIVDPNDANTVYVAMDTGVYVTQTVSTCAAGNCWSVLGTGLPNSAVTGLTAGASLDTGDGRKGMLRAGTYGRGIWETPLLTAVNLAQPAMTLSATSFAFGSQQVGTQSAAQTLTITSTGNAAVTFGTPAFGGADPGDFAETDDCAGQTIAVNATCTVQMVFAPTVVGARSAQMTIYANVRGGQAMVQLSGSGTTPASIVLTPLNLTFAATVVNQTTAAQIITIANTGQNPATLQSPMLTGADPGDFAISADTCGATLAASTACSVAITFTPTASGARSATLSVTDSVGTQTAQLNGTGNAPATDTLSPLSLTFAQQQIGTVSAAQQVTLTNSGDVALTLIAASITAGDFAVTNACGNSLNAHASCALSVTFVPTATGERAGTLSVSDQFRTQTVPLHGTGLAGPGVTLSPASLSFPATGVGLTTQPQTLTLTNNGGVTLNLASVAASAGFTLATNGCGATLAAGAACAMSIVFTPSAAGAVAGTLTLTDDATPGTQAAVLAGVGVDFTLTSNGPTTVTLPSAGGSGSYPLLLSSAAGLSGSVAIGCRGVPGHATCVVVPAVGQLGGTETVSVTVETGLGTPPAVQTSGLRGWGLVAVAMLLPVWCGVRRRAGAARVAAMLVMAMLGVGLVGCGADRLIPNSQGSQGTGSPTPKGTYTLTVSGAAAGLTHSVQVTLVVD